MSKEPKEPTPPKVPAQKEISHFEVDAAGLQNISEVLNELIPSKYVKQVIILAIDDNIKPVYKG